MANKSTTGPLPGPVRQIGYVVRDLESALAQWVALGIQQHGDTPSIFTEFLDSGREGLHQLAWWADDFDAGTTRFAYVEPPAGGPATVYELMELTEITSYMGAFVRDAARDWDGSDPVRTVDP